jgi:hypothetical protein
MINRIQRTNGEQDFSLDVLVYEQELQDIKYRNMKPQIIVVL